MHPNYVIEVYGARKLLGWYSVHSGIVTVPISALQQYPYAKAENCAENLAGKNSLLSFEVKVYDYTRMTDEISNVK